MQYKLPDVTDSFLRLGGGKKKKQKVSWYNVWAGWNNQRGSQQKDGREGNDTILCMCEPPWTTIWVPSSFAEFYFDLSSSVWW